VKDILRDTIYLLNYLFGSDGTFSAEPGTLKYRFLTWLYGEPELAVRQTQEGESK
jgi:hypothetical protein